MLVYTREWRRDRNCWGRHNAFSKYFMRSQYFCILRCVMRHVTSGWQTGDDFKVSFSVGCCSGVCCFCLVFLITWVCFRAGFLVLSAIKQEILWNASSQSGEPGVNSDLEPGSTVGVFTCCRHCCSQFVRVLCPTFLRLFVLFLLLHWIYFKLI